MFKTTPLWNTVINATTISNEQKLIFGYVWWQLLLFIIIGILFTMVLCCVICCTIVQARRSSSANFGSAAEVPSNILIHPTSMPSSSTSKKTPTKTASMKVKLLSKRDIRSSVQDNHKPFSTYSNKKRSHWEHSLDYSNPYHSKRRPYSSDSNYSA